jgi:hypothetical protein
MLRRAIVAAFSAAVALAAGCATQQTAPEDAPTPYEPAAPETTPSEGVEAAELREDAPMRYVVKKGDTLWGIANKFLKDSWQWPELWYVNPKVANPHLIYPGDELFLYFVDGQAHLAKAGETPAGGGPSGPSGPTGPAMPPGGEGTFTPTARELPVELAIPAIPAEQIRAFLRGPRVIDEDQLDDAPYIVDFEEKQLFGAADSIAYALDVEDETIGQYQIVRRSKEYEDPDDGDDIGYEVLPVGDAEVRVFGDPATIYIVRSDMEARAGDYLLPVETDPLALRFIPHAPEKDVDGKIISVHNGMSQIGQFQIVTLNRGKQHGLEIGHVLNVSQAGRRAKDPNAFFGGTVQLPDLKAGTVMVFKVGDRVSHALVMSASRSIHIGDKAERPEHSK